MIAGVRMCAASTAIVHRPTTARRLLIAAPMPEQTSWCRPIAFRSTKIAGPPTMIGGRVAQGIAVDRWWICRTLRRCPIRGGRTVQV